MGSKISFNKIQISGQMQEQQMITQQKYMGKNVDGNSINPANLMSQIAPYQIISQIGFDYIGVDTYRQMLDHPQYDRKITVELMKEDINILDDQVFLFVADLQPDNIQWQVFKHSSEIDKFIDLLEPQIQAMRKVPKRKSKTGESIILLHQQLKNLKNYKKVIKSKGQSSQSGSINCTPWQHKDMKIIEQFVRTLCNHPYLRKSVVVLTFIYHCMPMHLWNIKVYQQVPIFNDPTIFTKLFVDENQIKQYLTVTGDGIIVSSKNPIETKIEQMVPFTNQFSFTSEIELDGDLYFKISSCIHENISVNFKKDYVGGLNFHIGTKRALVDSKNYQRNRFDSFSGPRKNCWVKLYADGSQYFSDVYDQLINAKKQVLITDWWLTPYINLKRAKIQKQNKQKLKQHNEQYMVGKVLSKIANKGIKVYIILFREPLNLLSNDSYQCQLYLEELSPNIRIRRHPITPQLWSHHEKCVIIDQKIGFMGGLDLCYGRWDTHQHHLTNHNNHWIGGDYVNQRIKSYTPGTTKDRNTPIDQSTQPRMPWHDIGIQLKGDAVIDLARHFVQYWYFVDAQRVKDPYNHFRNLSRRFDRAINHNQPQQKEQKEQGKGFFSNFDQFKTSFNMFLTGTQNKLRQLLIEARSGKIRGQIQLQLCRSSSPWSIGARKYEQSIHFAYKTLIRQSEHIIYIQNQFFMGNNNDIVQQLVDRIEKAYLLKQNFKIVVVMPLLPGFQGEVSDKNNRPLRVQIKNQFESINRGENSIHEKLKQKIKDPRFNINDYIYFFGLRGHGKINGVPVTQIIYVHSKLMIVDDKRAIIGSANINDRSLCGNRDSQLAIVIEEDNGEISGPVARRKQIFDLRARLFHEHFGLDPHQTANSNNPIIWEKMINNAKSNTLIYRTLFGCYPDDTITVSGEIQERKNEANIQRYEELAPKIFANAVEFPLHFMEDEDLSFQFLDKQEVFMGMDAFL